MTNRIRALAVAAACTLLPAAASAQLGEGAAKLGVGYTDIGPAIGLGGLGEAGLSIGGRFERVIKDLPDFGKGTLGIGVSVDAYSFDNAFYSYRYIPIGATANYHFNLSNKKIVPFLGLGLGYSVLSCDYDGPGANGVDLCDNSSIYFIGRAGARYFMTEKLALYGDVGAGAATLNVGIMFRLR